MQPLVIVSREGLKTGEKDFLYNCSAVKRIRLLKKGTAAKVGAWLVKKGNLILTDCNVTGTDTGTPDNPKFSLRLFWEFSLLPSLDALVAPGGHCEGAIVVHQEDKNTGKSLLFPYLLP